MKKIGLILLCSLIAVVSVLFSHYMTLATEEYTRDMTAEEVYLVAKDGGYEGGFGDFIIDFAEFLIEDGRDISSAKIDSRAHLIITYDGKDEKDAGSIAVYGADSSEPGSEISREAVSSALDSSVAIFCESSSGAKTAGAGVIYSIDKESGDAYVVTNYHVIYNTAAQSRFSDSDIIMHLYGMLYPSYKISCEYVGGSATYDIAVLKINDSEILKNSNAQSVRFANSEDVAPLDAVMAVGNPMGDGFSVTRGSVSVESEYRYINTGVLSQSVFMRLMRVDAAINDGNSGGGLYDAFGRLVGIVTAKNSDSAADNIAYATPINLVSEIVGNILYWCDGSLSENGRVVHAGLSLEVKEVTLEYNNQNGRTEKIETVFVKSVETGSFADSVGISVGDIIKSVSVDGVKYNVKKIYHTPEALISAREGSEVSFTVIRSGEEITLSGSVSVLREIQ